MKKQKKLTVTIGIPAYNEERSISSVIDDIFSQSKNNYHLSKVIVISDASTDLTVNLLKEKSSKHKEIEVIDRSTRVGKPEILNQIMKLCTSDILIVLDADIRLTDRNTFELLIDPIIKDQADVTWPKHAAMGARTIVQKLANYGVGMWDELINELSEEKRAFHSFSGILRVYKRNVYRKIHFPNTKAEDVFNYIDMLKKKFRLKYIPLSTVYFENPETINDYMRQMSRFLTMPEDLSKYYSQSEIDRFFSIPAILRVNVTLKNLLKSPITTIEYITLHFVTHIVSKLSSVDSPLWVRIKKSTNPAKVNYRNLPTPSLLEVIKSLFRNSEKLKNKQLKVLLYGYFGMKNIGDDAILSVETDDILKLTSLNNITVVTKNPSQVLKQYKFGHSIRPRDITSIIRCIYDTDLVVIGGGGLFNGVKGDTVTSVINFIVKIYTLIMLILFPKIVGKKVVIFNVGFYKDLGKMLSKLLAIGFTKADYISVRDRHSYDYLRTLISSRIRLEKDVVFKLDQENKNKLKNYFSEKKSKKVKVGLSLVPIRDERRLEYVADLIADFIDKNRKKARFYLMAFNESDSEPNDLSLINKIVEKAKTADYIILPHELGPKGFLESFRYFDFAYCTRFHSLVFAIKKNTPFLGISYSHKCSSLLEDYGIPYVRLTDLKNSNLQDYFVRMTAKIT